MPGDLLRGGKRMRKLSSIYSEMKIGDTLPVLEKWPTTVQLFRYSSVTWNTHRIHYDLDYAKEEGYPGVLVQSHLHGAFLTQLCTDWMGTEGKLKQFAITVKQYATVGDRLTCHGVINRKWVENEEIHYGIELNERNQNDETCATGNATIVFPKKG